MEKEIKKFISSRPALFCTPGHRGRIKIDPGGDITELNFSDNLYNPRGIILTGQKRAAEVFGAGEVFFLTSGATQGIFCVLGAFRGRRVAVSRGSHKSIFGACALFNIEPKFYTEPYKEDNYRDVSAFLLTYPDYYGKTDDIKKIKELCAANGIPLLADAAHGSHFGFSPRLPASANAYADIAVLSAHKTLPVLTQGAYLCVNDPALTPRVREVYKTLGTTSPSYLILNSLTAAADYMAERGAAEYERLYGAAADITGNLPEGVTYVKSDDFTRMTLAFPADGFSAMRALNALGVYPEFADFNSVTFILTPFNTAGDFKKLKAALKVLSGKYAAAPRRTPQGVWRGADTKITELERAVEPKRVLSFLGAALADKEYVAPLAAAGRAAAAEVGFYPPAVPLFIRGEEITEEAVKSVVKYKSIMFGLEGGKIAVVSGGKYGTI